MSEGIHFEAWEADEYVMVIPPSETDVPPWADVSGVVGCTLSRGQAQTIERWLKSAPKRIAEAMAAHVGMTLATPPPDGQRSQQ